MRALNIAATGMAAQNMRVEVISHNLANMNTTAYNARRAEFADLHYQQVQRPGTINSSDGTILPAGISSASAYDPRRSRCRLARDPSPRPATRSMSRSRVRAISRSPSRTVSRPIPATGR